MGHPLGYWVRGNEKPSGDAARFGVGMWYCNYLTSAPITL